MKCKSIPFSPWLLQSPVSLVRNQFVYILVGRVQVVLLVFLNAGPLEFCSVPRWSKFN